MTDGHGANHLNPWPVKRHSHSGEMQLVVLFVETNDGHLLNHGIFKRSSSISLHDFARVCESFDKNIVMG